LSIPELLAACEPSRVAVVDGDVTLTYGELRAAAQRFAGGIAAGERVAIWAPNSWKWIVAVLGLWEAGATLVPINTRFKGAEASVILERSGATKLLTDGEFLGVDYASLVDVPGLTKLELGAPGPEEHELTRPVRDEDVSDILFTSGTTGVPKGVVMTHGRTLTVARDWVAMTGLSADDRYLMVNPYFHMFGLKAGILACVTAGAAMYPEPVFDAGRVLQRVQDERITVLPGAPTLYQSLLDHPDRDAFDLSSLRVAVTGAADIPVTLIERVRAELPFSLVVTGYGLTEAGTVSATSPDDDPATVATTVGRARPGYAIRIDGGDVGEILVQSPTIMREYLDDPAATAEAIVDGWLHTGDLGTIGEDGCLRIVGRSKDMFIVGGFNAYPAEIENALLRHPDVQQVAVIGVPDERLGEVGMAFVVPAGSADGEAILKWCRDEMANYKVPRRIEFVDALPMNATGKVVKDELRAMVKQ
jgi:acyl-CoA synthetase (AMP-forming)/AMP-acid ligase II